MHQILMEPEWTVTKDYSLKRNYFSLCFKYKDVTFSILYFVSVALQLIIPTCKADKLLKVGPM